MTDEEMIDRLRDYRRYANGGSAGLSDTSLVSVEFLEACADRLESLTAMPVSADQREPLTHEEIMGPVCPHCRGTGQPGGVKGGPDQGLCSYCHGHGHVRPGVGSRPVSPQDPLVILAGIEQFGLAADGADLRDLRSTVTRLLAEIAKAEEDEQHWFEEATYEVGGAPRLWKDRAEAAEAERDRLREALEDARETVALWEPHPKPCLCRIDDVLRGEGE